MSRTDLNRALRGGARAVTGMLVVAAAAGGAVLIGATALPTAENTPVSLTVDTLQGAERRFVCAGSFAELGADADNPGSAVPTGSADITLAGTAEGQSELARQVAGGSAPVVLSVPAAESFAAAQSQTVATTTLSGLAAAACTEAANEQWLVGGATGVGASTTINLGNPSEVPATVQLTVYDENGQVDSALTSGVLVPAGSERVVSLNGYAPARERLVVRVDSTGAAVTASLGIGEVSGLEPFAVDTVTRQLAGSTTLVIPGVTTRNTDVEGPGDTGGADSFPVVVRALSTTGQNGTATVRALFTDGQPGDGSDVLGTIDLVGSAVGELSVTTWPEGANAIVIEADVPVVGGALASANDETAHDYAWFTPAPTLAADTDAIAAVATGGQLVIANPGDADAEVVVTPVGGATSETPARTVEVPAGSVAAVSVVSAVVLSPSQPVQAAVRIVAGGSIAGYPVLDQPEQLSSLTVYTR